MSGKFIAAAVMAALAGPSFAADVPTQRFAVIDPLAGQGPEQHRALDLAVGSGRVTTVVTWTGRFSIKRKDYRYRFVGTSPDNGTLTVPVLIVAIKLTVPDGPKGVPIVFDASDVVSHIVTSPLFTPSPTLGNQQFGDAMLRAEFPNANPAWHTLLNPTTGDVIDITAPPGTVKIKRAKSGKYYGFITDNSIINNPIARYLHAARSPGTIAMFITYNSVEKFAYGYHSWRWGDRNKTAINVYMYSSWMEDIDDVLGFPSPDAATLSHEVAETLHDPLISNVTREWGDPFNRNSCFDTLIEVGDAIEDAGLHKVYAKEEGMLDGAPFDFTVQNMALLPWFTRENPSSALNGAYSFPVEGILTKPARMRCVP
jgi:hypothetical protein